VTAEWIQWSTTIVIGVVTGGWAAYRWKNRRDEDSRLERNRMAALYVNPFLFACEDLQSRLYNMLMKGGLDIIQQKQDANDETPLWAYQLMFFVAQYFAYEGFILRYSPYGTDPTVIRFVQQIREAFAQARLPNDVDPWCLFRPDQKALGSLVLLPRQGALGTEVDTISLWDFRRAIGQRADLIELETTLRACRGIQSKQDLPERSCQRFEDVQGLLVDLLAHLEGKERLDREGKVFTVSLESHREKAKRRPGRPSSE
jgi:hypothetical protein